MPVYLGLWNTLTIRTAGDATWAVLDFQTFS